MLRSFFSIMMIFSILNTLAQSSKPKTTIEIIEIEKQITKLENSSIDQNHELEKTQMELKAFIELSNSKLTSLEDRLKSDINKTESKIEYYFLIGGIVFGLIGFAVNFFGRKLIKERVELLVKNTAAKYVQLKTEEFIQEYTTHEKIEKIIIEKGAPAIKLLLEQLEKQGFLVIDGIKRKGDEAISSMLAKQNPISVNKGGTKTDEEIANLNKASRIREFFELAYNSKDSLVQIELYKNVLSLDADNIEALNNIGVSYMNSYKYETCLQYLTKCLEISPLYSLGYANRANCYNQLNDLARGLVDVNKAIELDPNHEWAYTVKGNILTKQGDLKGAEDIFSFAISINPRSPELYLNRGYFYEEIKKYEESERDYQKADELGISSKAVLYNNFAVLYRRQKRFDLAIEFLERARQQDPSFPNIDGTLALIYADKKDSENFYKYLVIALEKGCPAWNYLSDSGFNDYRKEEKLNVLLESYKKKRTAS